MHDVIASIDLVDAEPDTVFEALQRWLSERGAGFRIAPGRTLVFETPFLISAWQPAKVSGGELTLVASGRSTRIIYRLSLRALRVELLVTFTLLGSVWSFGLREEMGGGIAAMLLGPMMLAILGLFLYFMNRELVSSLFAWQVRKAATHARPTQSL